MAVSCVICCGSTHSNYNLVTLSVSCLKRYEAWVAKQRTYVCSFILYMCVHKDGFVMTVLIFTEVMKPQLRWRSNNLLII